MSKDADRFFHRVPCAGGSCIILRAALLVAALMAATVALAGPEPLAYGYFPSSGSPNLLVILIKTPDHPATLSKEQIRQMIFSRADDGVTSMAEFYEEVSYGALHLQGAVTDWIALDKNLSRYAGGSYGQNYRSWPDNLGGFVADAVSAAVSSGVDLAAYDNDGDGHIDGLMIIHAGPDGAVVRDKKLLWSRVDYISMYGSDPLRAGDLVVDRFGVCPEFIVRGRADVMRICAHEFGHLLGLPDLYDPDRSSFGIGANGLMGILITPAGMTLPPAPSAHSKMLLGWVSPLVVSEDAMVTLPPAETTREVLRLESGNPGEYFLIENRARINMDASLAGHGVQVWHADDRAIFGNSFECEGLCKVTPRLALVQADGQNDLERKKRLADPDDFFPGPEMKHTVMAADTGAADNPFQGATTLTFAGMTTGLRISGIALSGDTARLRVSTNDHAVPVQEYPWPVVTDVGWEEISGNGNGFAEPGERIKLYLTITNLGRDAERLRLDASADMVGWKRDSARIRRLSAGESGKVYFNFTAAGGEESSATGLLIRAFTENTKKKKGQPPATANRETRRALARKTGAQWLDVKIKVTGAKPAFEKPLSVRMPLGVPALLVINDAPANLLPYLEPAIKRLKVPYHEIDVSRRGLPGKGMAAACPVVVWLCGTRALDGNFPGLDRLALMRAVKDAGHVLVFNISRVGSRAPLETMEVLGVTGMQNSAGIRFAKARAGGLLQQGLLFAQPYPYYPDLNPHLALEPGPEAEAFVEDSGGRPAGVISYQRSEETGDNHPGKISVVLPGFPLESLRPESGSRLIERIMTECALTRSP